MKKILGITVSLCFITIALASPLSYDHISITSHTWEEVDLTYTNIINGKEYTEHANLLRPISWVNQNHLDQIGTTVHLTKEQLGVDINVRVIAIKPTKLNYGNHNHENIRPVIATFITHNTTWEYTFKDQHDHTEIIQVVSGHPFYSKDKQAFVPIEQIKIGEPILSGTGQDIILVSRHKLNQGVKAVYNFEVYEIHRYFIGNSLNILAHNPECTTQTEWTGLRRRPKRTAPDIPRGPEERAGDIEAALGEAQRIHRNAFRKFFERIFGEYHPINYHYGGDINSGVALANRSFSGVIGRVERAAAYGSGIELNLGGQYYDMRAGLAYADGAEITSFANFTSIRGANIRIAGGQGYLFGAAETFRGVNLNLAGITNTTTIADVGFSGINFQLAGINANFIGLEAGSSIVNIGLSALDISATGYSLGNSLLNISGSFNKGLWVNGFMIYPPLF